jgi:hypothetical protein
MLSASTLYNLASGQHLQTTQQCFLCGGSCGTDIPRKPVQSSVVTPRTHEGRLSEVIPATPGGSYCCSGCRLMCRESITIHLVDGQIEYGMPVRDFSWILTGTAATPYRFPRHRTELRRACLQPTMKAPWAIVLSDTRCDYMYRTPVNDSTKPPFTVTLNGAKVAYDPADLRERINFSRSMSMAMASIGKDANDYERSMMMTAKIGHETLVRWNSVVNEPLTKLAMFLCPMPDEPMEESPQEARREPAQVTPKPKVDNELKTDGRKNNKFSATPIPADRLGKVAALVDGVRTPTEIGKMLGLSRGQVLYCLKKLEVMGQGDEEEPQSEEAEQPLV